jgi:hypothetical protein
VLVATCCAPLLFGCDNDLSAEEDDPIAGAWIASVTTSGSSQTVAMSLSEIDNVIGGESISGSGSVTPTARTVIFR